MGAADAHAGRQIHDWERAYWIERVKSERLAFDSQSVRPYFAFERVKQGILEISAELYGVRFERNTSEPRWHPSVECYDVFEQNGERSPARNLNGRPFTRRFHRTSYLH